MNRRKAIVLPLALFVASLLAYLIWSGQFAAWFQSPRVSLETYRLQYARAMDRGDSTGALEILDETLAAYPDEAACFRIRGLLYLKNGKTAKAVADFEKALAVVPDDVETLTGLAACRVEQKDLTRALEIYQRLEGMPDKRAKVYGLNGKALINSRLDHLDIALGDVRRALEVDPQSVKSREILGNILQKKGDYLGAVNSYTAALRIDRSSLDLYHNRARAYLALDMYKECRADLEMLLQRDPDNVEYKRKLEEVKAREHETSP